MLQGTSEADEEGASRAKSLLLKKKLEDKDRVIREKDEEIQLKEQHVLAKEKIIEEREDIIKSLTTQLQDKTKMMEEYQESRKTDGDTSEAEVLQIEKYPHNKTHSIDFYSHINPLYWTDQS